MAIRDGRWRSLLPIQPVLPSASLALIEPDSAWEATVCARFRSELERARLRLAHLDGRVLRDAAERLLGGDPEKLRQRLFPFGKPMERVLPGLAWLREESLLDRMLEAIDGRTMTILVEEAEA
jgi:hypothetical protein